MRAWSAEATSANTPRWEYRVLTKAKLLELGKNDLAAGLNQLGEEGWELVAVDRDFTYIFKRPKDQLGKQIEDVKGQIALIEADVESLKDRVSWAERMAKKGFMTEQQVQAAQQFFYEDVFKPAGGLRFPVRATLVTFAFSALVHEYVFGIAIGRVQGYQTAFFLLQGVATAATVRVKVRGWTAALWFAGTFAFNLASSVLFFASTNAVLPFYSRGLPAWLAD